MVRLLSLCFQVLLVLVVRGTENVGDAAFAAGASSASSFRTSSYSTSRSSNGCSNIRREELLRSQTTASSALSSSSFSTSCLPFLQQKPNQGFLSKFRGGSSSTPVGPSGKLEAGDTGLSSSSSLSMTTSDGESSDQAAAADVTAKKSFLMIEIDTILKTIAIIVVTYLGYTYRSTLSSLFNKEQMQTKTLAILNDLNTLPKYKSYTSYVLGMAIWEMLGLSTIPVETAAGMVFGWIGFVLSGTAKLLGATMAFSIGRYGILAKYVQKQLLEKNTFIQLVEKSTKEHPFKVLVYLKASCFPETIKNYGAAVLFPITLKMFMFATMIHGWTFTALWTFLGVDTAKRLAVTNLPTNKFLQVLLVLSIINGVVVSPLAMGLWMKSLQDTKQESEGNGENGGGEASGNGGEGGEIAVGGDGI